MIRIANKSDLTSIRSFVSKDFARNYFIAISLINGLDQYKEIYIEDNKAMLFLRKSGNLQFVQYGQATVEAFKSLIKHLNFTQLIGPKSMCHLLALKVDHEGAFISSLKKKDYTDRKLDADVKPLLVSDLDAVVSLYSIVFSGYAKTTYMTEKLKSNRGIGYKIQKKGILSVAQSDFGSVIVGVATHPNYQHKGYALKCMHSLIQSMFLSHDEVYLQYDKGHASKLYEKLGFKPMDQIIHYSKGEI